MKKSKSFILSLLISFAAFAQYDFDVSKAFPFGQPNPEAPSQIKDYEAMIGECNCESMRRNPDGTWAEPENMIWRWKYILNGMAVQDETLKEDGSHSGSIRQYIVDSSRWYVHWFSSKTPTPTFPVWEGDKKEDKIVLYKEQTAPNGADGFYRLTFYDISKIGYKWIGEWVDKSETVVFPTWKINCTRKEY
jgi:hypothetical protein